MLLEKHGVKTANGQRPGRSLTLTVRGGPGLCVGQNARRPEEPHLHQLRMVWVKLPLGKKKEDALFSFW